MKTIIFETKNAQYKTK